LDFLIITKTFSNGVSMMSKISAAGGPRFLDQKSEILATMMQTCF
jgi:hypothetical protein